MNTDQENKEAMFYNDPINCAYGRYVHEPYYYHPHWHDFLELLYVKKGWLQATLRNTMLTVNKGELLVVMPGELHSTANDGEGVYEHFIIHIDSVFLHNVIFDSKELSKIYPYLFNSLTPHSFLCGVEEVNKAGIPSLIQKLIVEFKKRELGYNLSIRAGLLEIFVWLLRRWDHYSRPVSEPGNFSRTMRMQPVLDLIREQYHTKITTNEMAGKMYMSVPHFCRLFKNMTGYSFHNYVRSLRIVEAIKLLLSTDDSVKQIASHVGYNDENFFVRVFKKETGMPPDKYRKKYAYPLPSSANRS